MYSSALRGTQADECVLNDCLKPIKLEIESML